MGNLRSEWGIGTLRQEDVTAVKEFTHETLALMQHIGIGELMPRWLLSQSKNQAKNASYEKPDGSWVTDADYAAEAVYNHELPQIIPGSIVLGEEGGDADPESLIRARQHEWVWIVDPLDGTSQFRKGGSVFGTVVALLHHGQTVFGAIHQPVTGHTAFTIKGAGAVFYGTRDGKKWINRLDPGNDWDRSFARTTAIFAYFGPEKHFLDPVAARHPNHISHLHAHADYLAMLRGEAGFIRFSEGPGKCPPWDHAAGALMIEESGGIVRVERDGMLAPYDPTVRHDRLVVACDPATLLAGLRYVQGIENPQALPAPGMSPL